ncbi:MAG: hypothetical protein K2O05_00940 [Anaeroplasmataceae bacterium]|nr:hypothetical protein [Anaeroplasmataceae bacterium]
MICKNCNQYFYVKRGFLSLFESKKYYICDACMKKNPIHLTFEHIPLENYELVCVSLLSYDKKIRLDAYSHELSRVSEFLISKYKNYLFVYFDIVHLSDFFLEELSFLADGYKMPILLFCGMQK